MQLPAADNCRTRVLNTHHREVTTGYEVSDVVEKVLPVGGRGVHCAAFENDCHSLQHLLPDEILQATNHNAWMKERIIGGGRISADEMEL